MNIALTVPLADGWGMHGSGWWLLAAIPMMLFMGATMWMMMRGMMGGGSSPDSSARSDASISRETPMEILERRFAEGEISIEEYRARREALVDRAAKSGGDEDERRREHCEGVAAQRREDGEPVVTARQLERTERRNQEPAQQ